MSKTKMVDRKDIVPEISRVGQQFYDQAVMREVSKPSGGAVAIARAFGSEILGRAISELSHYERTRLRWVKPPASASREEG